MGVRPELPIVLDPVPSERRGERGNTPIDTIRICECGEPSHYVSDGERIWWRIPEGYAACPSCRSPTALERRSIALSIATHCGWTAEVWCQVVALCADVATRHGISIDRQHVIAPDGIADDLLECIWMEAHA